QTDSGWGLSHQTTRVRAVYGSTGPAGDGQDLYAGRAVFRRARGVGVPIGLTRNQVGIQAGELWLSLWPSCGGRSWARHAGTGSEFPLAGVWPTLLHDCGIDRCRVRARSEVDATSVYR